MLENYKSMFVGPWCIEQNKRGCGVFSGMWDYLQGIIDNGG